MKYDKLGLTDIEVSKVSLGTWGLGGGSVWTDKDSTEKEASSLLSECAERGINYIDTAPVYGTGVSENLLGKALKGRRDKFVLQTKCSLNWRGDGGAFHYERDGYTVNNDTSRSAIKKDVEDSLKRLETDYIDSIIVHYVTDRWPVEETVSALDELVKDGKIRAYGISNSQVEDIEKYHRYGNPALVQEFFSILSPFHGRDYFPALEKYGITFQVYGVLEEGYLTGPEFLSKEFKKSDIRSRLPWNSEEKRESLLKAYEKIRPLTEKYEASFAQLFLAWALGEYGHLNLLVGMRRKESVFDSTRALDIDLDSEDRILMEESVKSIQEKVLDK